MTQSQIESNFQSTSREVLKYLHDRLGFGLWMMTRAQERDWVVLQAEDHHYGVKDGDVFLWADSFCTRMVNEKCPRIAPCSNEVPEYATAPIGEQVQIGAYIGMPVNRSDGTLFGTLCAIDPHPQPQGIVGEFQQIQILVTMLETILEMELKLANESRRADRAEAQALTDPISQTFNAKGWDQLLAAEELRCQRYAHQAAVVTVALENTQSPNAKENRVSDETVQHAAKILGNNIRKSDILARVSDNEFRVLAVECMESGGESLVVRLQDALMSGGLTTSIGWAPRQPTCTLDDACRQSVPAGALEMAGSD